MLLDTVSTTDRGFKYAGVDVYLNSPHLMSSLKLHFRAHIQSQPSYLYFDFVQTRALNPASHKWALVPQIKECCVAFEWPLLATPSSVWLHDRWRLPGRLMKAWFLLRVFSYTLNAEVASRCEVKVDLTCGHDYNVGKGCIIVRLCSPAKQLY